MTNDISLQLYERDGTYYGTLANEVSNYKHEHTRFGPYIADWTINAGDGAATAARMESWFNTWLLKRVVTINDGREVWEGYIWEMTLSGSGLSRYKSLEPLRNKIKVGQRNQDNNSITQYTYWFEDGESQEEYGVHEHVEMLNGSKGIVTDTTDERKGLPQLGQNDEYIYDHDLWAVNQLESYAYPTPAYTIGGASGDAPTLQIKAVGRAVMANKVKLSDGWLSDDTEASAANTEGNLLRDSGLEGEMTTGTDDETGEQSGVDFSTVAWGDGIRVSDEIRRIVGVVNTASGWLYDLDIQLGNHAITGAGVSSVMGAIDRLRELAQIPDQDGNLWDLRVTHNGGVTYRKQDVRPYFYFERDIVKHKDGQAVGWRAHVTPIDMSLVPTLALSYVYPERVTVANGEPLFSPLERTQADIDKAIRDNIKWLEDIESRKKRRK